MVKLSKKKNINKNNKYKSYTRKIPNRYLPKSLTSKDKKKQLNSILKGTNRPYVKSFKSKKSQWVTKFENRYGFNITDKKMLDDKIIAKPGIEKILAKGRGAYYSGGSRPNQTPHSWAYARLASVIMGGNARKVDKAIWEEYKKI